MDGIHCDVCKSFDDVETPAVGSCNDCTDNLCELCLTNHTRNRMTRNHVLEYKPCLSKPLTRSTSRSNKKTICQEHKQVISLFCKFHDAVGCSVCMKLHHTYIFCNQAKISDIALELKGSNELIKVQREVDEIRHMYKVNIQKSNDQIVDIEDYQTNAVKDIKEIMDRLTQLKQKWGNSAHIKDTDIKKMKAVTDNSMEMLSQIDTLSAELDLNGETPDDECVFIMIKKAKHKIRPINDYLRKVQHDNQIPRYRVTMPHLELALHYMSAFENEFSENHLKGVTLSETPIGKQIKPKPTAAKLTEDCKPMQGVGATPASVAQTTSQKTVFDGFSLTSTPKKSEPEEFLFTSTPMISESKVDNKGVSNAKTTVTTTTTSAHVAKPFSGISFTNPTPQTAAVYSGSPILSRPHPACAVTIKPGSSTSTVTTSTLQTKTSSTASPGQPNSKSSTSLKLSNVIASPSIERKPKLIIGSVSVPTTNKEDKEKPKAQPNLAKNGLLSTPSNLSSVGTGALKTSVLDETSSSSTDDKESDKSASYTASNDASGKGRLAGLFRQKEGSWTCDGCSIQNNKDILNCPCCNTLKPGVKKEDLPQTTKASSTLTMASGGSFKFSSQPRDKGNLTTESCFKPDDKEKDKAASNTASSDPSDKGRLACLFRQKEGSWTCDGCYIQNNEDITSCRCCNTLKPGVKRKDLPQTIKPSSTLTLASGGSFNFFSQPTDKGNSTTESGFKLPAAGKIETGSGFADQPSDAANILSLPTPSTQFKFGKPTTTSVASYLIGTKSQTPETSVTAPSGSGGFKFGNSATTTSEVKSLSSSQFSVTSSGTQFCESGGLKVGTITTATTEKAEVKSSAASGERKHGLLGIQEPYKPLSGFLFGSSAAASIAGFNKDGSQYPFGTPMSTETVADETASKSDDKTEGSGERKPWESFLAKILAESSKCDGCLVSNNGTILKCKCFGNMKPADSGTKAKTAGTSFGSSLSAKSTFCFGKSSDTATSEVGDTANSESIAVSTNTEKKPSADFNFGGASGTTPTKSIEPFKFKLQPTSETPTKQPAASLRSVYNFAMNMTPTKPGMISPLKSPGIKSPDGNDDGYFKVEDDSHIHFEPVMDLPHTVEVKVKVNGCTLVWYAMDCADGELESTQLSIKFSVNKGESEYPFGTANLTEIVSGETASKFDDNDAHDFKSAVEKAKVRNRGESGPAITEKMIPTPNMGYVGDNDDVVFVGEDKATDEEIKSARALMLPDHFYLHERLPPCPGCRGCTDAFPEEEGTRKDHDEDRDSEDQDDNDNDGNDDSFEDDYDDEDDEDEDEKEHGSVEEAREERSATKEIQIGDKVNHMYSEQLDRVGELGSSDNGGCFKFGTSTNARSFSDLSSASGTSGAFIAEGIAMSETTIGKQTKPNMPPSVSAGEFESKPGDKEKDQSDISTASRDTSCKGCLTDLFKQKEIKQHVEGKTETSDAAKVSKGKYGSFGLPEPCKLSSGFVFGQSQAEMIDSPAELEKTHDKEIDESATRTASSDTSGKGSSADLINETWTCGRCYFKNSLKVLSCPCWNTLKPGVKQEDLTLTTKPSSTSTIASRDGYQPSVKMGSNPKTTEISVTKTSGSSGLKYGNLITTSTADIKSSKSSTKSAEPCKFERNQTSEKSTKQGEVSLGSGLNFSINMIPTRPDFKSPLKLPEIKSPDGTVDGYLREEGDSHIYFVMFVHRAKLFRFDKGDWKEIGLGNIKVLHCKNTNKAKIIMRRKQILKLCCNQYISKEIKLKPMPNSKGCALVWYAVDCADGDKKYTQLFYIEFKNAEVANDFESAVEKAKARIGNESGPAMKKNGISAPLISNVGDNNDVVFVGEDKATDEEIESAQALMLPDNFYLYERLPPCSGFRGCIDTFLEEEHFIKDNEEEWESVDQEDNDSNNDSYEDVDDSFKENF